MILHADCSSILVPWNFSAKSERALARALEGGGESTRIHVLHIAPPLSGPDNGALFSSNECSHRSFLQKRFWSELPDHLRDARIRFEVEFGMVGRELVRFATQRQIDSVIMTRPRKTVLSRMPFCDLEAYLQKRSPCPIEILRPSTVSAEQAPDFATHRGQMVSQPG